CGILQRRHLLGAARDGVLGRGAVYLVGVASLSVRRVGARVIILHSLILNRLIMCLGLRLGRHRLSIGLGWLRLDEAQGRRPIGSPRRRGPVQGVGWLSGYGGLCGVDGVVDGLGSRVWVVCR